MRLSVLAPAVVAAVFTALLARADVTDGAAPTPDAAAADARALYEAGTDAFAARNFAQAALEFEAASLKKPSSIALYIAALSWEKAGVLDRAADAYARALAMRGLPPDKVGPATERLSALERGLGAVVVTGPKGTRAALDVGTEVAIPATLHGVPGPHTLTVRNDDQTTQRLPVALVGGGTIRVNLPSETPPSAPSAALAEPKAIGRSPDLRRSAGIAALGAGAMAGLASVLIGLEALDARDAYVAAPSHATYDHALGLQTWTDVAIVTSVVLAGGGLALILWPAPTSRAPLAVGLGPRGPELAGSF